MRRLIRKDGELQFILEGPRWQEISAHIQSDLSGYGVTKRHTSTPPLRSVSGIIITVHPEPEVIPICLEIADRFNFDEIDIEIKNKIVSKENRRSDKA